MTGYGAAERGDFRVEVRSLNHRYLEANIRLPYGLLEQEIPMRNAIRQRFARGRFDVFVNLSPARQKPALNGFAAKEVHAALENLRKQLLIPDPVGMRDLLLVKDLFMGEEGGFDTGLLFEAFNCCLDEVEKMRVEEGGMIKEDVLSRAAILKKLEGEMESLMPVALAAMKDKFVERLKEVLADFDYEETRLIQEAAILSEKADISEELTRIKGHIEQIGKIIQAGDKIGREFDFLMQELHREANTIGSKMDELTIIRKAIEFKTEVERIRQQVQNLQ